MSDDLKSAWEIALEKLEGRDDMAVEKLSEEQKQAIAEIRTKYQSRIAEVEINSQSQMRKALEAVNYEEVEKLNLNLSDEKRRLNRRMEKEIKKIRTSPQQ